MGVELIRVLVANEIGPILLIAFTNHALDHMLTSVLQAGITKDVVRLGGRSSDPAIASFSMEEIQKSLGRVYYDRSGKADYAKLKETEERIGTLLKRVIGTNVPSHFLMKHLTIAYPDHAQSLKSPPQWIIALHELQTIEIETNGQWLDVKKGKAKQETDTSLYAFWRKASDLKFLTDLSGTDVSDLSEETYNILSHIGDITTVSEPESDRSTEELIEQVNIDVWNFSASERSRVHDQWEREFRDAGFENNRAEIDSLLVQHERLRIAQKNRDEAVCPSVKLI